MQSLKSAFCILTLSSCVLLSLGNDCVYNSVKMKVGDAVKAPQGCMQLVCQAAGTVLIKGCPLTITPKPCKVSQDRRKPYPDCCPIYDCA